MIDSTAIDSIPAASFEAVRTALCRKRLSYFISQAWHIVEPNNEMKWNWHLDILCNILEALTHGTLTLPDGTLTKKLIVNIPPGTGKSLVITVFWPAWEWTGVQRVVNGELANVTIPGADRYLTASYTDANTIRDNLRVRDIVTSTWYKRFWPNIELAADQSGKVRFNTSVRGWRIATSVAGKGTGEHPTRIIKDDPHKADEARSKVKRDKVTSWDETTISTRKGSDPVEVIVMQRLHGNDHTAHKLSKGGYYHLLLPMRYEVATEANPDAGRWPCECHQVPDSNDIRTQPGELLFPTLWPESKVAEVEIELGEFGTAGQLQQRPTDITGGLFKRDWFNEVEVCPADVIWCRGWDTAATADAGDWTAGVKIGVSPTTERFYIASAVRARVEDADVIIEQQARLDGKLCKVREETEGGSSGKRVIKLHRGMLVAYDFEGVSITGDKITRARPLRKECQAGNVDILICTQDATGKWIYTGEWVNTYLDEVCSFPMGSKHDDQVDASSCAFNALTVDIEERKKVGGSWGRRAIERRKARQLLAQGG